MLEGRDLFERYNDNYRTRLENKIFQFQSVSPAELKGGRDEVQTRLFPICKPELLTRPMLLEDISMQYAVRGEGQSNLP